MVPVHSPRRIRPPERLVAYGAADILVPIKCVLHEPPHSGYDGSLDDDPKSPVAYIDAPLNRAVGCVGHAPVATAALRNSVVGIAGHGLLAWVVAAGSKLATYSNTDATTSTSVEPLLPSHHDGGRSSDSAWTGMQSTELDGEFSPASAFDQFHCVPTKKTDMLLSYYLPKPLAVSEEEKAVQEKFKEMVNECIDLLVCIPAEKRRPLFLVFSELYLRWSAEWGCAKWWMALQIIEKLEIVRKMVSSACDGTPLGSETVFARKVEEQLHSLREGGVPPRFLIIDDGWQETFDRIKDVDEAIHEHTIFAQRLADLTVNHKFRGGTCKNLKDLCELKVDLYKRMIMTIKANGSMPAVVIGEVFRAYAYQRLLGSLEDDVSNGADCTKHRAAIDATVFLLPAEDNSVPSGFLIKLLRAACLLESGSSIALT
jgi:hypothetical protein